MPETQTPEQTNALIAALQAVVAESKATREQKAAEAARVAAITPPAPVITQTDDAAAKAAAEALRTTAELTALQEKLARQQDIIDGYSRQTRFDLRDATHLMAETLQVKPETKSLYGRLGAEFAFKSKSFAERYGESRSPLEILIKGALIPDPNNPTKMVALAVDDEVVRDVRRLHDGVYTWMLLKKHTLPATQCPVWPEYMRALGGLSKGLIGKALDTTDMSVWVPVAYSAELIKAYELERRLAKALRSIQVPRFPYDAYTLGAAATTYAITENTVDPEDPAVVRVPSVALNAGVVHFTRHTLAARIVWSYNLDEDSVVDMGSTITAELGRALALAEESMYVDGDTASPHMDSDTTAATDVRKQLLGFRAIAIDRSYTTSMSGGIDLEKVTAMKVSMNKYAARPADLIWVGPPMVQFKLGHLKDASGNAVMIGVPGGAGQVIAQTGDPVLKLLNSEYVTTEGFRVDLNVSGVYDGSITSTGFLLINKERWAVAYTGAGPKVEIDKDITTQQHFMVATMSRDLKPLDTNAGDATNHTVEYAHGVLAS